MPWFNNALILFKAMQLMQKSKLEMRKSIWAFHPCFCRSLPTSRSRSGCWNASSAASLPFEPPLNGWTGLWYFQHCSPYCFFCMFWIQMLLTLLETHPLLSTSTSLKMDLTSCWGEFVQFTGCRLIFFYKRLAFELILTQKTCIWSM